MLFSYVINHKFVETNVFSALDFFWSFLNSFTGGKNRRLWFDVKQECIPVGCILPILNRPREGVSLTETPVDRDPPLWTDKHLWKHNLGKLWNRLHEWWIFFLPRRYWWMLRASGQSGCQQVLWKCQLYELGSEWLWAGLHLRVQTRILRRRNLL